MIDEESLKSDEALLKLYKGAVAKGYVQRSPADCLNYFAAAEQALMSSETPGNLFAWIVCGGNWDHVSDEAEDRAIRRLKRIKGAKLSEPRRTPELQAQIDAVNQRIVEYRRRGEQ